jgi:hypothetical protein
MATTISGSTATEAALKRTAMARVSQRAQIDR